MKFDSIPGMIEPVEQELLYEVSKALDLSKKYSIVELGSFFGKSTNSIIHGLNDNSTNKGSVFHAYDSFKCQKNGNLAQHVVGFSEKFKVNHLLKKEGNSIDFLDVFKFYTANKFDKLKIHQNELLDSTYSDKAKIAFLFIDAPKFYNEFYDVLKIFFLHLDVGSKVIFQDFFFHWSGTVIPAIEIMFQRKLISFEKTAASSLLVTIEKKINKEEVRIINDFYQKSTLSDLIQNIYERLSSKKIDRHNYFLNRLIMAKIQVMVKNESNLDGAKKLSISTFNKIGKNDPQSAKLLEYDLQHFFKNNFDLQTLYNLDHL